MLLSLDNLGSRYSMLPSQVLEKGTTLDFLVLNTSAKYEERCRQIRENPEKVKAEDWNKKLSTADMQQMMDQIKTKGA